MSDRPAHPRCMTPDEFAAWDGWNQVLHPSNRADSPCRDCSRAFAGEMRAAGLCDGRYPGEPSAPAGELMLLPSGRRGYSESDRIAARRATWRASSRRHRLSPAA
jgi:hypothetical protein